MKSYFIAAALFSFVFLFLTFGSRLKASDAKPCQIVNVEDVVARRCPDNQVMTGAVRLNPPTIVCGSVVCD